MKIMAKLGNMRKAVEWIIYPKERDSENITIQSDHRIAVVDLKAGICLLSKHCSSGAYRRHLSKLAGATVVPISAELVAEIISKQPKAGDTLGRRCILLA